MIVIIATLDNPCTYSFMWQDLTQHHYSWTADAMVIVTILSFHQQFFHKSCATILNNKIINQRISIIPFMKGYCSYHYFNHSKYYFLFENLESQSFTTENWLCSSGNNNLYLYSVWISALFCCAAQPRPLAGNRLRPQAEVVVLASAAAISSQLSVRQCVH